MRELGRIIGKSGRALVLAGAMLAGPVWGQDLDGKIVVFEDLRGGADIEGRIADFDETSFKIVTAEGEVVLDRTRVRCRGLACPEAQAMPGTLRIGAEAGLAHGLLADALSGYAAARDLDLVRTVSAGGDVGFRIAADRDAPLSWSVATGAARDVRAAFLNGVVDFALLRGALNDAEKGAFRGKGLGDPDDPAQTALLGYEPLVVIAAPGRMVGEIGDDRLAAVLSGEITDWADLGGARGAIQIYVSGANDGAAAVLARNRAPGTRLTSRAERLESDLHAARAVVGDENGMAIVGASSVRNASVLRLDDACGHPMVATAFDLKSGAYPYFSPIVALRSVASQDRATDGFWGYLTSPELGPVLAFSGHVDVAAEPLDLRGMGVRMSSAISAPQTEVTLPRLRSMMTILQGAERLSPTIRFRPGRGDMDADGAGEIARVLDYLLARRGAYREVIIAGFTDSIGTAEANENKSLAYAETVRAALREAGRGKISGLAVSAHGFGEIAPLICNDTEANRAINRRVEIWLR